ncbi:hypothetical protein NEIFLAOT_00533 [Neisseria flavescens NRL30031/H210]|uniref:Uncharacterized protein n=1 Tax=Neisseria flavescens NRL30031/H210 TaxID=546264 RepID=C0EKT1_NEIFL|nr:hypothetical protein NEIFLAOT_00533 [Neisseria flavescens NRL30031/H210]
MIIKPLCTEKQRYPFLLSCFPACLSFHICFKSADTSNFILPL